jgi:penicillin-binding protein 1B
LVALDPKTGGVRALVGGRDYGASQFNRAVQAKRQAGSLLKPFVYLAALERGIDSGSKEPLMTPATLIEDSPINFPNGEGSWSPQNYDRKFHGTVTVRTALEQSLNVPAVRVAYTVGVPRIIELLHHLGIKGSLDEHLSLALGSSEVSLLEITGAYAAFANGGRFVPPTGLQVVASDKAGEVIAESTSEENQVFSSQGAYLITSSLKGVVERGTAAAARGMGLASTVAGKTGTTDDHRDAWFIGYTSDLVIGVWVGFDDAAPIRLSAAQAALPIWVDFFRKAVATTSTDFAVPAGVVMRVIDPISGQLATSSCPESQEEVFLEGTEPKVFCVLHSPGFLEKLKRMFGM